MTAKAFRKIMETLLEECGTALPEEGLSACRRLANRVTTKDDLFVIPVGAGGTLGDAFRVRIRDLSRSGLAVDSPRPMSKGNCYLAYIPGTKGDPLTLRFEVCRCSPPNRTASHYSVGAQWEHANTEASKSSL